MYKVNEQTVITRIESLKIPYTISIESSKGIVDIYTRKQPYTPDTPFTLVLSLDLETFHSILGAHYYAEEEVKIRA